MPDIPSAIASRFNSMTLSSVKPGSVLPLYSLSFWSSVRLACLGGVSRVRTAHMAAISIGPVRGDLAIVDVAGELGRVLVLLVLGLEGADADAVLLRQDQPVDLDVIEHLGPVAAGPRQALVVHLPAERAECAADGDLM